ncbi:MAG TPA: SDR family oxidoreductase [Stellaceae bacterium]|nr:SDR family oxidoreductase [Stellaceae bacterium]
MSAHVAIVTGGLSGLGRAMALGLARAGERVLAVGHIEADAEQMRRETAATPLAERLLPLVADLRRPAECDRVIDAAMTRFGRLHILVNNAGLTFTYIWPDLYRRAEPPKFWELADEIVQNVMDTNYVAADQMARRAAPLLLREGWGRIINVTTKLDTMNRATSGPYGASKAALEMATEIWAQGLAGTGVTVNILNPGAGAHTPGMAVEASAASRAGRLPRFVEPEEMVVPLLWLVSAAADRVHGYRFDALTWDRSLPPEAAARKIARKAGFALHPLDPGGV